MKNNENIDQKGQLTISVLQSEVQRMTPEGIEMGVMENGMPYLSQRGLVKMAGIARTSFQNLTNNWESEKMIGVGYDINKLLLESGYEEKDLYIQINSDGKTMYAYTEPVCLAILEYYAFDAKKPSRIAQNSFRLLSKAGFRVYVYGHTGYKPDHTQLDSWKHFHDRIDLVSKEVPSGYFCVFREISGMIVSLIRNDIIVNDKIIPDISVGQHWSKFWTSNKLDEKYGKRINYKHNYPEYYPQSKSNPQPAKAYPDEALALFRRWFEDTYLVSKFPTYMLNKVKAKALPKESAEYLIDIFKQDKIEKKTPIDPQLKKALDYNPKNG